MARGTPMASSNVSSQSSVSRFMSIVRLALVTSVTWRPVRFQTSQLSMVPNSRSPSSARLRIPGALSSSQLTFAPDQGVGACVLPDDRVVHRLPGVAVPDHGGLALVGDADGNQVADVEPTAV